MVSAEITDEAVAEPQSGPRISFSGDFLDENEFISINPHRSPDPKDIKSKVADFEFLSSNNVGSETNMITADELFFEGKLLPYWKTQHAEKLNNINLKSKEEEEDRGIKSKEEQQRVSWFLDDDPSPRPPNCTVLWKELLRLRKNRSSSSSSSSSSLSPSSSSSSNSSSSSSMADAVKKEEGRDVKSREKNNAKRVKKGLERSRSGNIRIRPMINMPICTQTKSAALPPLFPLKKGRLER